MGDLRTKKSLPDVTIVCIDCIYHDLTRAAILDTLEQIEPEAVLIFSDREILDHPSVKWIKATTRDRSDAFKILWYSAPLFVETSHFLHIEWDGWVLDGNLWSDDWLRFDYIGAPWPWHYRHRVGNGGFSLRSLRLARFLMSHPETYPFAMNEDDVLCRDYRAKLEGFDFHWANEWAASEFSIEHGALRPTFGFHDCRNWPRLLDMKTILGRVEIAGRKLDMNPSWCEMLESIRALA